MKKIIALVLCLVSVLSLLAGCNFGTGETRPQYGNDGREIITIGIARSALVEDYDTNAFTLWLEETTGYDIQFEFFSGVDANSQLATRITAGILLPDILFGFGLGDGVRSVFKDYGDSGFLIDLKPYFDDKEKSKVFWDRLAVAFPNEEEQAFYINKITDQEHGAMYVFPFIEKTEVDEMNYQVYINKVWLDKLNLEMPTDNESLVKVLKAFRDNDCNGNGNANDEYPLVALNNGSIGANGVEWLLSLFEACRSTTVFNWGEDGNLYFPYASDAAREAYQFINDLITEGLLDKSCWSMNNTGLVKLLNPADGVNTVGVFVGHPSVVFQQGQMSNLEYEALPLWSYAVEAETKVNQQYFITADCKNPDAAWEVLMAMCSDDGQRRMRYGEYGVDWIWAEEGQKSYLGYDAGIVILQDIWGTIGNQNWRACGAGIAINNEGEDAALDENIDEWSRHKREIMADYYHSFDAAQKANPHSNQHSIRRTKEEADLYTVERTNVDAYFKEMITNFCLGTAGADAGDNAQWAAYLKKLDDLGLQKYMAQNQEIASKLPDFVQE